MVGGKAQIQDSPLKMIFTKMPTDAEPRAGTPIPYGVAAPTNSWLMAFSKAVRFLWDYFTAERCPDCKEKCDSSVCWCGDEPKNHGYSSNHGFIPMGCRCGFAEKKTL
jgi:hypothetical protein